MKLGYSGSSHARGPGSEVPAVCRWIHVAVLLCLAAAVSPVRSELAARRFEEKPAGAAGRFDGVAVHRETGDVYVASTSGAVYQLTDDLRFIDLYRGPENNTATRLLELIPSTRTGLDKKGAPKSVLLYCGTDQCVMLDCGGEHFRPVSRFPSVADVVLVNGSSSSDVLLLVPDRQPSVVNASAAAFLYCAVDDVGPPTDGDTLAALVLGQQSPSSSGNSSSTFHLRYRADGDGVRSGIRLQSGGGGAARQTDGRRFVHAFDDGRFAYFVFVQASFDGGVETRLARVCVDDDAFHSYTELVVLCRRRPTFQTYFAAAVAAVVAPMGATLARRLGERAGDDWTALYVVMGDAVSGYGVCIYPLADVRRQFTQAQRDCYRGSGRILATVDADEPRCTEDVSFRLAVHFLRCAEPNVI